MAFNLSALIGGSIGDAFQKIVGAFKVDPTKALEAQTELSKIQFELQSKIQDAVTNEVTQASENIRAEATNGDKYTSRARPTFLYLMYVILGWNYIFLPLIQYIGGRQPSPIAFPDALMWLFGSGYLGYTGARSWDKFSPKVSS